MYPHLLRGLERERATVHGLLVDALLNGDHRPQVLLLSATPYRLRHLSGEDVHPVVKTQPFAQPYGPGSAVIFDGVPLGHLWLGGKRLLQAIEGVEDHVGVAAL